MISHTRATFKHIITVADDFGLSPAVNAAVAMAHRDGILTSASLMVAAPHAAEAVEIGRAMPTLRVGLHLVLVEGPAILPSRDIPALVGPDGWFPSAQVRLGFAYARPKLRRQLAAEIHAQFAAFARTGLALDHADAHKHMHLHPVIGRMMIDIDREFGLRAIRVPAEPGHAPLLRAWCRVLRAQARAAGMLTNDQIFGLSRSGHMTRDYVRQVLARLPPGLTELYFHPATETDATLRRFMPAYQHAAELEALLTTPLPPNVIAASYTDVFAAR